MKSVLAGRASVPLLAHYVEEVAGRTAAGLCPAVLLLNGRRFPCTDNREDHLDAVAAGDDVFHVCEPAAYQWKETTRETS